jgi:hypothetical protein
MKKRGYTTSEVRRRKAISQVSLIKRLLEANNDNMCRKMRGVAAAPRGS